MFARLGALILLASFALLGTGAAEFLHNRQHESEDAQIAAAAKAAGLPIPDHKKHDDSNCAVHAQLHMPAIAVAWVPLLICLGLLVAFLSLLTPPLFPQRVLARINCRGPPAC